MTHPTSGWNKASRVRSLVAVALGALVALSGCSWGDGPGDAGSQPPEGVITQVGPLKMLIPEGEEPTDGSTVRPNSWFVQPTVDGVTTVHITLCEEGRPCPQFDVIEATTLPDGFDGNTAWLPEGSTCPGNGGFLARNPQAIQVSERELGDKEGVFSRFSLECVDGEGNVQDITVEQRQWFIAQTASGPVVVVDRWSTYTLDERLIHAEWPS